MPSPDRAAPRGHPCCLRSRRPASASTARRRVAVRYDALRCGLWDHQPLYGKFTMSMSIAPGLRALAPSPPNLPSRRRRPRVAQPAPTPSMTPYRLWRWRKQAMPQLTGKIAWVTGAGTGIGEAAALALAEEGATVILTGRRRAAGTSPTHPQLRRRRACAAGRPDRQGTGAARRRLDQGDVRPAGHPGEQRRRQHRRPPLGQAHAGEHR